MIQLQKVRFFLEKDYDKESKIFVKKIMAQKDISFVDLTKKLNEAGFNYSEAAVRQKISRGRFDFAFALQICDILECKIDVIY